MHKSQSQLKKKKKTKTNTPESREGSRVDINVLHKSGPSVYSSCTCRQDK